MNDVMQRYRSFRYMCSDVVSATVKAPLMLGAVALVGGLVVTGVLLEHAVDDVLERALIKRRLSQF